MDWDLLTEASADGDVTATRYKRITQADEFSLGVLLANLRGIDRLELSAIARSTRTSIFRSLLHCVQESRVAWKLEVNGNLEGVGGCGHNGKFGSPWLLLSPCLPEKHGRAFNRLALRCHKIVTKNFAPLFNFVHANSSSHGWLERMGYKIARHRPPTILGGEPFFIFSYGD